MFGGTEEVASATPLVGTQPAIAAGNLITAPAAAGNVMCVNVTDASATNRAIQIGMSNNNSMIAGCSGAATSDNFTAVSKHVQGNITYGIDSDVTLTYQNAALHDAGDPLVAGDLVPPTSGVAQPDDFVTAGAPWVLK
jgi:hypothetical protein